MKINSYGISQPPFSVGMGMCKELELEADFLIWSYMSLNSAFCILHSAFWNTYAP